MSNVAIIDYFLSYRTPITLFEVNENLDKIVLLNAQKKGVNEILFDMFRKMNALMFKWLVRIILKDVKIGLGQKKVFNYFHDDANDLYDTNANFRKVSHVINTFLTCSCRFLRYRTLLSYQPDPMPSFLRHTLRSRIQNVNLF